MAVSHVRRTQQEALRDLYRAALADEALGDKKIDTWSKLKDELYKIDPIYGGKRLQTVRRIWKNGPPPIEETRKSSDVLEKMRSLTLRESALLKATEAFYRGPRATDEYGQPTSWFQIILPQARTESTEGRDYPSVDVLTIEDEDGDFVSGRIARVSPPLEDTLRWEFRGVRLGGQATFITFWPLGSEYLSRGTVSVTLSGKRGRNHYDGYYIRPGEHSNDLLIRKISWRTEVPPAAFHRIALLDFDNTLYNDWSIRGWLSFLSSKGWEGAERALTAVNRLIHRYERHELDHDALSDKCAAAYGSVLRGRTVREVEAAAKAHVRESQNNIYPFVKWMVEQLILIGVGPYLLTGAPAELIKFHAENLGIDEYTALTMKVDESGTYTGAVKTNPARADVKAALIAALTRNDQREVVLAAGDSDSDVPSLDAASAQLLVGERITAAANWDAFPIKPEQRDLGELKSWIADHVPRGDYWHTIEDL